MKFAAPISLILVALLASTAQAHEILRRGAGVHAGSGLSLGLGDKGGLVGGAGAVLGLTLGGKGAFGGGICADLGASLNAALGFQADITGSFSSCFKSLTLNLGGVFDASIGGSWDLISHGCLSFKKNCDIAVKICKKTKKFSAEDFAALQYHLEYLEKAVAVFKASFEAKIEKNAAFGSKWTKEFTILIEGFGELSAAIEGNAYISNEYRSFCHSKITSIKSELELIIKNTKQCGC